MRSNRTHQAPEHAVVTGGAGFVGSHLVDDLLDAGYRVTSLDNYGSGRAENLDHHSETSQFTAREHDVRTSFPEFDSVDYLYHLASRASPADFETYPVDIALTNSLGTHNALECAREHDATVLLASTSEVYGDPDVHPQHERYNGNVNPRGLRAPYDEGKRFAEALGIAYETEYDLDIRTVRVFNTYGPRMRVDDGRSIPTFITQALEGTDLTVHGIGEQTRSFCYVSDLVDGIHRLATTPAMSGEVVNLGSTNEITIRTLAETIRDLVETPSEIRYCPRPADDPEVRRPTIERATDRLGWQPTTGLETGLEATVDYFRKQMLVNR